MAADTTPQQNNVEPAKCVEAPGNGDPKKKQPPFWEREVKIENAKDVDAEGLLTEMYGKYIGEFRRWKRKAKVFKCTNMLVTLLIVAMQVAQVILFQIPELDMEKKAALATILPTVTGAVLAIQLKLGWAEKSVKSKKSARLYHKLAKHTEYRLSVMKAGGEVSDSIKVWNAALKAEATEIPPFLVAY